MLYTFLLVVHGLIAAALVGVILMQRSEGGGLTSGGSPSGLMSARGAANFLTRATAMLAAAFIGMSILLAVLAASRGSSTIDQSLAPAAPKGAPLNLPPAPAPGANPAGGNAVVPIIPGAPAPAAGNDSVPIQR